jgi:hypothetical protein
MFKGLHYRRAGIQSKRARGPRLRLQKHPQSRQRKTMPGLREVRVSM